MVDTKNTNDEVLGASLRELNKHPFVFEIDKVVYLLIRLNKIVELVSLLSVRLLHIEQLEIDFKKNTHGDYSHALENEYFNKQRQDCMNPILQILESVYMSI